MPRPRMLFAVTYYYGVLSPEVRTGSPEHTGKAVHAMSVGTRINYTFARRKRVVFDPGASHAPTGIANGRIMRCSCIRETRLGHIYQFN